MEIDSKSKPSALLLLRKTILMFAAMLLVVLGFPALSASPASASPGQIASYSLVPDGDNTIVLGAPTESALELGAPVGSPGGVGAAANSGLLYCTSWTQCRERFGPVLSIGNIFECAYERVTGGSDDGCRDAAEAWNQAKAWIADKIATDFEAQIRNMVVGAAQKTTKWVIVDELGGQSSIALPTVNCQAAEGPSADNCNDGWFLGQFSLMRKMALFMILPMLMLVVMQSVIRGSLFMLMRAALIMLPVSILGMVAAVTITQILLNITDAVSLGIMQHLTNANSYGTSLDDVFERMKGGQGAWFSLLWMVFMFLAAIAIFFELVIRQTGIYIAMLILPVGFAALVWPSTAKWARRLIELLIGLIFSKVVIVATMALGITAVTQPNVGFFSHTVEYGAAGAPTAQSITSEGDRDLAAIMAGTLIMCAAAFQAVKVMQMVGPAAIAGTVGNGRLVSPQRTLVMGQVANTALGFASQARQRIAA